MNHRKRRATDELLPTSRPLKAPRIGYTYLKPAAVAYDQSLTLRWIETTGQVRQLVGDTVNEMLRRFSQWWSSEQGTAQFCIRLPWN